MSGGNQGSPPSTRIGCEDIFEQTVLNSPVPSVISKLKKGDTLRVSELKSGKVVSLVAKYDNDIAGSITITSTARILACIERGFKYVAIVVKVDGGSCTVDVRPDGGGK